jgi:regulator of sigma E protease
MIGHMAQKAGEAGVERYLEMLAMISINLGIINLLPIPVLDGGHLMLFTIEAIKRGPLSLRTRQIASFVGLAIVVFLMIFAFKNDIERYWQVFFG